VKGYHSNEGVKEGYHSKSRYFIAIGSSSVKTVVDTYYMWLIVTSTTDGLFRGINIDDLKRS